MIKVKSLSEIKPENGWLILDVESVLHDTVETKSGIHLFISSGTTDAYGQNAVKHGTVIAIPNDPETRKMNFSYKQPLSVEVGDTVEFDYSIAQKHKAVMNGDAIDEDTVIECEGKKYFLVPYGFCYANIKDGVITGLNGMVIGKPHFKKSSELQVIDDTETKLFEVCCNTIPATYRDGTETPELQIGEIVVHKSPAIIELEYGLFLQKFGFEQLYRISGESVMGVLDVC